MEMTTPQLDLLGRYLAALERFEPPQALAPFFTPDVAVHELPNRLVPQGRLRAGKDLAEAVAAAPRVLSAQRYQVHRAVESGDTVVLDVSWSGTLKVPLGQTAIGGTVRARISMWVRFRGGQICEQTNFDCYDAF
jgi:ketosteroid isomerase-like protein